MQIRGHSGPVSQLVSCHPSKAQAISCSYDKSVRVWDVSGSQAHERCCLLGHTAPVLEMGLQGEKLATGGPCWGWGLEFDWDGTGPGGRGENGGSLLAGWTHTNDLQVTGGRLAAFATIRPVALLFYASTCTYSFHTES